MEFTFSIDQYQKHEKNVLYQSVMDVIIRANPEPFREEAEDMCEALMELMKDKKKINLLNVYMKYFRSKDLSFSSI